MSDDLDILIGQAEQVTWTDPDSDLKRDCTCPDCGQKYSGADSSGGHCRGGRYPGCCQSFRSNTTADAHFVRLPGGKVRCSTPDEMRARGWNCDEHGVWRAAPPTNNPWKKES
jgi:hypothetical protein